MYSYLQHSFFKELVEVKICWSGLKLHGQVSHQCGEHNEREKGLHFRRSELCLQMTILDDFLFGQRSD